MEIMEIITHPGFYVPAGIILYTIIGIIGYVFSPEDWVESPAGEPPLVIISSLLWPIGLAIVLIILTFAPVVGAAWLAMKCRKLRVNWTKHRERRREEPKTAPYGCVPEKKSVKR